MSIIKTNEHLRNSRKTHVSNKIDPPRPPPSHPRFVTPPNVLCYPARQRGQNPTLHSKTRSFFFTPTGKRPPWRRNVCFGTISPDGYIEHLVMTREDAITANVSETTKDQRRAPRPDKNYSPDLTPVYVYNGEGKATLHMFTRH